jgi:hypothetical protein
MFQLGHERFENMRGGLKKKMLGQRKSCTHSGWTKIIEPWDEVLGHLTTCRRG